MVLGFGKKRRQATFKDRVTAFWGWYVQVADRFYSTIEEGRCADLAPEVGEFMEKTLPGLSWVFGPGEGDGHSFTVTGEGNLPMQLLAEYWANRAPEIPKWTFHASRQPTAPENLKDIAIQISEHDQVDVETFLLKTSVDEEAEAIDIVAWHPAFDKLPEEHHFQILFLLLDEALGEFGTEKWLGDIKIEPIAPGEETKLLTALPTFVEQVNKYHGWEKLPPLKAYSLYEIQEQSESRRGDTLVGTTCIPNIVFDFLKNDGSLPEDPFDEAGAEFAYVAIDASVFPDGQQSDVRGNIEDALSDALADDLSGRTLGGAFGLEHSYIDLLLLDGDNSRQIVQDTLYNLQLHGRSRIESFL